METGYDLIFKWIPRMVIFGLYLAKKVPFTNVYLHGLVLDAQGKKMSKSKGNVVNPLELTAKYGTDALRMALVVGNPPGADIALSEDKIRGYRNFSTKLWNIARFIEMRKPAASAKNFAPTAKDKKYIAAFKKVKQKITGHMDKHRYHLAAETTYHYIWHTFADIVIEEMKPRLENQTTPDAQAAYATLEYILIESLAMLHPFMPFVTETIYQKFGRKFKQKLQPRELLMIRSWENK